MMAFRMVREGFQARANHEERAMLSSLARDVVVLLGSDVEHEAERRAQAYDLDDPLAQFEADIADIAESIAAENEPQVNQPFDQALDRLLPDMSEDPDEAASLRDLTENSIAAAKIENLVTFYQDLEDVPDDQDEITLRGDQASAWLAALNDIRLVLAARLEIDDDESASDVYRRAGMFTTSGSRDTDNLPEIQTSDDVLVVLYSMTTWWQDSLVSAVRRKGLRR
ncbi:putative membrane protein YccC [Trueperella bonasi]|uniref:Membrane protein YccC n=1 Tax=Trueperella bonasi TaxID=312286 RepID=A0ABT9NEA1_9ACTO|nr:DUF2017 family protein [Trueperella bonasi]MDP9805716.1 putative membrane protein YccC [Trueperella bonasi]